jgi:hypothetical protein
MNTHKGKDSKRRREGKGASPSVIPHTTHREFVHNPNRLTGKRDADILPLLHHKNRTNSLGSRQWTCTLSSIAHSVSIKINNRTSTCLYCCYATSSYDLTSIVLHTMRAVDAITLNVLTYSQVRANLIRQLQHRKYSF